MNREEFIKDFTKLGVILNDFCESEGNHLVLIEAIRETRQANDFFFEQMQLSAIKNIAAKFLCEEKLIQWLARYDSVNYSFDRCVSVIGAGNLPLVVFHDYISVLAAGMKAEIKLSSRDKYLLPLIHNFLCEINQFWSDKVSFVESLPNSPTFIIASGNSSTMKMVNDRFPEVPSILRGSRFSVALLDGSETLDDLKRLSDDISLYFGMGCRSISTLLVPHNYDFKELCISLADKSVLLQNKDFSDSRRYNKAVLLMKKSWFIDSGVFILSEFDVLPPPIGCVNIIRSNPDGYGDYINSKLSQIQAVASKGERFGSVRLGECQSPELWDYPDGIDTVMTLLQL